MSRNKKSDTDAEEIQQAVIIADSFNRRFYPLTSTSPRCLLPLANIPIIEYTLEILALSGVDEIYILCCSHAVEIEKYLKHSRWKNSLFPKVSTLVAQQLHSVGDALREIDSKQFIRGDFFLLTSGVITNMDLTLAMERHKKQRQLDKNSIMTVVLRQSNSTHRTLARGEEALWAIDRSNKLITWESLAPYPRKLWTEIKGIEKEVRLYADLIDTHINICTPEVPALMTENFDWQDMRHDFLKGILESEILGKSIYTHIVKDQYAVCVSSPQMYHAVSQDILTRWTYPLVPESNFTQNTSFIHEKTNIYKEPNVKLAQTTIIESPASIGANSVIESFTKLKSCNVGRFCEIGSNNTLTNSYIMDNCKIGNSVTIIGAILGKAVTIGDGTVIGTGCLIEDGTIIPENSKISPNSKVFSQTGRTAARSNPSLLQPQSGFNLTVTTPVSAANQSGDLSPYLGNDASSSVSSISALTPNGQPGDVDHGSGDEYDDDDDDEQRNAALSYIGQQRVTYTAEEMEMNSESDIDSDSFDEDSDDDAGDWHTEAIATLERAISENHDIDIAALELNTLKMAMNITFKHLRTVTVEVLKDKLVDSKACLKWGPLISKFTHSIEDQVDLLSTLESFILPQKLQVALHTLYQCDVLSEDSILKWYYESPENKSAVSPFISWLEEAEEEGSSDEEGESDDDESDESDDESEEEDDESEEESD